MKNNCSSISIVLLVKNGERKLHEVLSALSVFEEIVLYDTGSHDQTLAIARQFPNVTIYQKSFIGFGPSRNAAAQLAKNDWILSVDADEVLSAPLVQEIIALPLYSDTVYALPFLNYFNGKWIKWCGWYPEKHVRLYHKRHTSFSTAMVHEGVCTKGMKEKTLLSSVYHTPYSSVSDFLVKMERYSNLFAQQNRLKVRSSLLIAITHGMTAFFKSFIVKRGFLGGYEGFLISAYNGHTSFYKYMKLAQENTIHRSKNISLTSVQNPHE